MENSDLNEIICRDTSFANENTYVLALSESQSFVTNNPAIQSTETIISCEKNDDEFFRLLQSLKGELFYDILKSE